MEQTFQIRQPDPVCTFEVCNSEAIYNAPLDHRDLSFAKVFLTFAIPVIMTEMLVLSLNDYQLAAIMCRPLLIILCIYIPVFLIRPSRKRRAAEKLHETGEDRFVYQFYPNKIRVYSASGMLELKKDR